jgi:hypothetical protein
MRSKAAWPAAAAFVCGCAQLPPDVAVPQPRVRQVDVGTFEGRQAGATPPVVWAWRSVTKKSAPVEFWAYVKSKPTGAVAPLYERLDNTHTGLTLQRIDVGDPLPPDRQWGLKDDPCDPMSRDAVLDWIVSRINACLAPDAPQFTKANLGTFISIDFSVGGSTGPATGLFAGGYFKVFDAGVSASVPVAWVWHPSESTGREVWCFDESYMATTGSHASVLSVTWAGESSAHGEQAFKDWITANGGTPADVARWLEQRFFSQQ